jgi:hypothetical protein
VRERSRPLNEGYAVERKIRDVYASRLQEFRPGELLWRTEHTYPPSLVRGDMRTVDELNRIRVWEFKIRVGCDGLGQILTYMALARLELDFGRARSPRSLRDFPRYAHHDRDTESRASKSYDCPRNCCWRTNASGGAGPSRISP